MDDLDPESQRPIPIWLGLLFAVYGVAALLGIVALGYVLLA
jgi:hypothetical protein